MPLRKNNTRRFSKVLWAGIAEKVVLFKRKDGQKQGTITAYTIFGCLWGPSITKDGQTLGGEMETNHKRTLYIPQYQLTKVGVPYITAGDYFEDKEGRRWTPLAPETLDANLFENFWIVDCEMLIGRQLQG